MSNTKSPASPSVLKAVENTATFGLLLVAAGLVAPFTRLDDGAFVAAFKWVYAAGALIFLISRLTGAVKAEGSLRMRRLCRLEFWAGMAFGIAAFFWFYTEHRLGGMPAGTMALLRNTVLFTLVGAALQCVASVMITREQNRQSRS